LFIPLTFSSLVCSNRGLFSAKYRDQGTKGPENASRLGFVVSNQRSEKDNGVRFVVPTLSTIELWKGWGTRLFLGMIKFSKTGVRHPVNLLQGNTKFPFLHVFNF
jgi:hypothetical protein